MDLDTGEVIWAGKGRSKEDFSHFFEDMPEDYLADVAAVAMDMNASYNILFASKLPKAVIVYDRYHMQAQYGKEVLGAVRLQVARKHQQAANESLKKAGSQDDPAQKRKLKDEAKAQKQQYSHPVDYNNPFRALSKIFCKPRNRDSQMIPGARGRDPRT